MGSTRCTNLPRCHCNKDMTSVDCYNAGLTSIPDIPATVLTLDLARNDIVKVPARAFSNLVKLQSLYLGYNKIQTVEPLAFEGLERLKTIDLPSNNIDTIPARAFSNLANLQSLNLGYNQIQTVEPLAFEGLESLDTIYLSSNNIDTIPARAFSKLPKLESLYLRNNQIQTIGPLAFEGLESITKIYLSSNNIATIPTRAFSKLPKLESLDLSYNQIQTIGPLAFKGLESLTNIDLSSNNIDTIPARAFSNLSKLESLDLSYNQIQTIEPLAFEGLESITRIYLSNNNIDTIPAQAFSNLPKLPKLDLSNNHILSVESLAFDGLQNLTTLYLNVNRIRNIAADAFTGSENISEIHLRFNALSEVPSIGLQPRLNKLDLSRNRIVNATFPSTYRGSYSNLSIDLSKNYIETLDRFTFSSLAGTTIFDIDLSHNNIRSVGPGIFDPLTSIETLYIDYDQLSIEALKNVADYCSKNQVTLGFGFGLLVKGISAFMKIGIPLGICASFSSGYVFEEFRNLTIIRLTKGDLFRFSDELDFPGKKNVLAMDLAENDFSSFPKYLPTSLEILDLRRNKVSVLYENAMSYLGSLKTLLLARNSIVDLRPGAFKGLGNLRVLYLNQTRIGSVPRDLFKHLQNLTHLYLGKNEIKFLEKRSNPLVSLRVLDLSDNNCEMVDNPFAESFPSLQILNLERNNLGKTGFLSGSGEPLLSGLTALEKVFISSNSIRNLPDLTFHDQVSLQLLDISKNQISGWGSNMFQFTRNISKVDISFNLIPVLTENNLHALNNLEVLHMTGNPYICNCDFLWFREWIDTTSVALPDKESYTCNGPEEWRRKPVLEFTKDKINCTMIPTIVGAVSGALVLAVLSVVLIYRNRWRLRLRLYLLSKRGRHFLRDVRGQAQHPNYGAINDDGRQDYYDAYISCSDRDYDWALHNLLPGIDNGRYDDNMFGGDFKLYFDPRDKEPGKVFTTKNNNT